MKRHATQCNLCRRGVTLAQDLDCPDPWFQRLLPLVRCSRCADFTRERNRLREGIERIAITLSRAEHIKPGSGPAVTESLREPVEKLTHRYAGLIQRHFRLPRLVWSPEFAASLLAQPDRWRQILRDYVAQARAGGRSTPAGQAEHAWQDVQPAPERDSEAGFSAGPGPGAYPAGELALAQVGSGGQAEF
jgi:hypothetical protein